MPIPILAREIFVVEVGDDYPPALDIATVDSPILGQTGAHFLGNDVHVVTVAVEVP